LQSPPGYSAGDHHHRHDLGGAAVQPDPFDCHLRPGDVVEAVGLLRNHVVPWKAAHDSEPCTDSPYS
jgi:hypothetical protein